MLHVFIFMLHHIQESNWYNFVERDKYYRGQVRQELQASYDSVQVNVETS